MTSDDGFRNGGPVHMHVGGMASAERPRTLYEWFGLGARRAPQGLALGLRDRTLRYRELEQVSRQWAGAIVEATGGRCRRVGLLASRSVESYGGLLAALCAGAAVVPLNPRWPAERNRLVLAAARVDALIVDGRGVQQLPHVLPDESQIPVIAPALPDLRDHGTRWLGSRDVERCAPLAGTHEESDIAYILFTSGSTGRPKGVPITHANVDHFLRQCQDRYRLGPDDRLTQTFEQTFDLSMFDLFMAWGGGASVHACDPVELLSPARFVNDHGITCWFSVPSVAALLQRGGFLRPNSMPGLRWSLFCGEPLRRDAAEVWQAAAPNSVLENLYGPTELTIACTAYRWDPDRSPGQCVNGFVPIGRPNPGLTCELVGDDGRPATGEGELCVSGPQMFGGYLAPEDDASRFLSGPGGTHRAYRTGDRVRWRSDAGFVFLGRLDDQVKLRGYRVELGEIEHALRECPGVADAAALTIDGDGESELVAFVTGAGVSQVTAAAARLLPHAMLPSRTWHLPELPRNDNGKLDRPALARVARQLLDREATLAEDRS